MRFVSLITAATLFATTNAYAADAPALVVAARQRIETTDARGTGRLVRVDAGGNRISNNIALKAHWFPEGLRVLLEVMPSRSPASPQNPGPDARVRILFEMRPGGQNTIRVFHPGESAPTTLAFDKWGEGVAGSDFNYEDFLQSEFYWQGQTLLKSARFGNRDCDVLKSTPGPANRSHYAEVQTCFDQTTGYPIHAEKTLKGAPTVKDFTSLGLTQSGGVWTARQMEVKVAGRPGSTLLLFERGSTKAKLSAKDFSPEQIARFDDHP